MNYLLVGRTGIYENIIAALVFMNKENKMDKKLQQIPAFGDINAENSSSPIFIREDNEGSKVYTLGIKNYKLINKIAAELSRVAEQDEVKLVVITLDFTGDNITYYLSRLANLPLIGSWFASLAKRWVLSRQADIIKHCQEMVIPKFHNKGSLAAAKPIK